ncbi:MAG TPA: ATP-binding protein [Sunxiuqinia sp.]|nr:ATP-binding protein [Sunxiuqinia sp.]
MIKKNIRIALTGPESTAKSTLTKDLANYFNGDYYLEYAREYFENHSTAYTRQDLETIAQKQIEQYREAEDLRRDIVFFDTWLIITKIWFQWVYKTVPNWIDEAVENLSIDLYLLCLPDIPWEPDPLRENGGEHRQQLFETYKNELIKRKLNFVEIGGEGQARVQNAIDAVKEFIDA